MIVIKLMHGLGNQMFQYALGRSLSIRLNRNLFFDLSHYSNPYRLYNLHIFNIPEIVPFNKDMLEDETILVLREPSTSYCKTIFTLVRENKDPLYLSGFWQSWKYFYKDEFIIKKDFSFKENATGKWIPVLEKIKTTESVMVHIRRGDYLDPKFPNGVLPDTYLKKAMNKISEKVRSPVFYFFSDDIRWCRENIKVDAPHHFIDDDYSDPFSNYYFQLMCSCRHFIIANSTFSWWAAWLAPYAGKTVIAPKMWYQKEEMNTPDIYLKNWIKL